MRCRMMDTDTAAPPQRLLQLLHQHSLRPPVSPAVGRLRDELLSRHGDAVQAILFYGSCWRSGEALDGLVDLYLIVDDSRSAYPNRTLGFLNALLPPNVFYLELPFDNRVVRTKYAVISLRELRHGTSRRRFHSYLWGRFAQPVGLLYGRDDDVERQIVAALARAVMTFMGRVIPVLPERFTASELWQQGLALSYSAELRAEKPGRAAQLFAAYQQHYERLTQAAMAAAPYPVSVDTGAQPVLYHASLPSRTRYRGRLSWALRRLQGKLLSLLRLSKALYTFRGGVDYIVWKLERHSGVKIDVPPATRRHPLLLGWGLLWRLYRRGVFR